MSIEPKTAVLRVAAPDNPELVVRARDGDADAFAELVRRHTPPLFRLLARMLGSPAAAEDVTQECFVRAWRALPRFRGEAKLLHVAVPDRGERGQPPPCP